MVVLAATQIWAIKTSSYAQEGRKTLFFEARLVLSARQQPKNASA